MPVARSPFARHIFRCGFGAQTTQEIIERHDASYQRFFKKLAKRPPKFKKTSRFSSFVFKQDGFRLNSNILVINKIKKHFKFSYSRPYAGKVKNVRVKRVRKGEYCPNCPKCPICPKRPIDGTGGTAGQSHRQQLGYNAAI